jgi:hypothetical protein
MPTDQPIYYFILGWKTQLIIETNVRNEFDSDMRMGKSMP